MPSQVVESFKARVIDPFRKAVAGRAAPLDYASYLSLPAHERAGDEASAVDSIITPSILQWLGFDAAGGWTYNENQAGRTLIRPDFVVHGPVGTAFIWEDKATPEEFTDENLAQLRKYVAGRSGYTIWCNARRILAHRIDSSGHAETIVDISLASLFSAQLALPDERFRQETALELFRVLFGRERFFDYDRLIEAVSCDEDTFLARAIPLATEDAQRDFIRGSRTVLERLRLAALTRIQAAVAATNQRRAQGARLESEWDSAATNLLGGLFPDIGAAVRPRLDDMALRVGTLDAADLDQIERMAKDVRSKLPATQKQSLLLWKERASRINTAARGVRLETSEIDDILDAFLVWRERQPEADLATASVFAEQVSYVFFVRLLLTRILEDKGLLPKRIASDGGFSAWCALVSTYFGTTTRELHSSAFVRLLSERISTFYQHFFHQPIFDWFIPDDYLLVMTLEFLSRYTFKAIGSDLLGFTYENYIDRVAQGRKGHFLTRPLVVEYMLDILGYVGPQIIGRRLLDPACGSASFLVHAVQRLRRVLIGVLCARYRVDENTLMAVSDYRRELARMFVDAVTTNYIGIDIDPFACYLAELNLLVQCLDDLNVLWGGDNFQSIDTFRIFNADSLDLPETVSNTTLTPAQQHLDALVTPASGALVDPSYSVKALEGEFAQGFYYVICNPPYVNSRQEIMSTEYRTIPFFAEALSGDTNLYLLFVRLGLHYVATGGRMVFILPLTLFGDQSAGAIRALLTPASRTPDYFVRFYTGNVLFPGVDQAVAVFRVDTALTFPPSVTIAGGRTVAEAHATTTSIARNRVVGNVPDGPAWANAWLISPDAAAYDVWDAARTATRGQLSDLYNQAFIVMQGDVNATHLNPLRVDSPATGDIAIYKGENIQRFAPLPDRPLAWAHPSTATSLLTTAAAANRTLMRLAQLEGPEDGFVLRQVSRLNTRETLKATWFSRDTLRTYAFTNELWRFLRRPDATLEQGKAVFGLIASRVTCYLLNL